MSNQDTVEIEIRAKIDNLKKGIARARKDMKGLAKSFGDAGAAADKTTKKADKNADAVERAGFAARAAGGRFGEMVERIGNAGRAFGPLGAIALVTAVGLTAVATAAAAASAAVVGITVASEAALDRIDAFSSATREQRQAIEDANDAMRGVQSVVDELTVAMGSEFAPVVERVATLTVAFGLAAVDAFNAVGEATDVLRSSAILLVDFFVGRFGDAVALVLTQGIAMRDLLGLETPESVRKAVDAFDDLAETIVDDVVGGGFVAVEFAMGGYIDQAGQWIDTVDEQTEAAKKLADELGKANAEIVKFTAAQVAGNEEAAASFEALEDAKRKQDEAQLARLAELNDRGNETLVEQRDQLADISDAAGLAAEGFGFVSDQLASVDGAFKRTKVAAVALFVASKAAALGQVVIDTAKATIALAVPPPIGLGPFAGPAFALATGGIAAGKIASQKPPSFHLGGVVPEDAPRLPGGGPRDRAAIVEPGEEILTERQRRGGGTTVNLLQLGHRFFDMGVQDNIDRGGALASAFEPETLGQARFRGSNG